MAMYVQSCESYGILLLRSSHGPLRLTVSNSPPGCNSNAWRHADVSAAAFPRHGSCHRVPAASHPFVCLSGARIVGEQGMLRGCTAASCVVHLCVRGRDRGRDGDRQTDRTIDRQTDRTIDRQRSRDRGD